MQFIGVTEGKTENLKKEGKMRIRSIIIIYKIHFAYLKVYAKFENTAPIGVSNGAKIRNRYNQVPKNL